MNKKRITYLDMAKGVGIIWVVMRHSQLMGDTLYDSLASIIMPLFFVVSGMLMAHIHEETRPMTTIAAKKAKSLLIPYVTFSISYLVINGITCLQNPELVSGTQMYKLFIYFISFAGISVMWFLPTMYVSELFFLAVRKKCNDRNTILVCVVAGIAGVLLAPAFDKEFWFASMPLLAFSFFLEMLVRSVIAAVFLCFGYYVKKYERKREGWSFLELLFGVLLFAVVMYVNILNGTVDFHYMTFNNPLLYFACANLGSLAVVLICKNVYQSKLLIFLGVNSLIIMGTHVDWFLLAKALEWSMLINLHVTRAKVYVLWACVAIFMLLMEGAIIFIMNRYFYFLLGKKKPEKGTK